MDNRNKNLKKIIGTNKFYRIKNWRFFKIVLNVRVKILTSA